MDTKHYYKAKIISRGKERGILAPCYVGNWSVSKGVGIELQKFWFCHDDQSHCVKNTKRKYTIRRFIVPSLWHVQEGTNLTQDEMITLKDASFFFSEKPKCHPRILFNDDASHPTNKLTDANNSPKTQNEKNICRASIFKISTQRQNKWKAGHVLLTNILPPTNVPSLRYGRIYRIILGPIEYHK